MMIQPFPSIEKALRQVIQDGYPAAQGHVGIALRYEDEELYVWLGLFGGSNDATSGEWTFDIDIFGSNYNTALGHASAIEALLLTPGGHRTDELIIDYVAQNAVPHLIPWGDDEETFRLTSTYVIRARRVPRSA